MLVTYLSHKIGRLEWFFLSDILCCRLWWPIIVWRYPFSNVISVSRTAFPSLWLNEVDGFCRCCYNEVNGVRRETIEQFLENLLKKLFFRLGTEGNPLRVHWSFLHTTFLAYIFLHYILLLFCIYGITLHW